MQKSSPMDFCFKLNEECDYFDAQIQQHGKILASCCDNKMVILCKYSDGSVWENCITVTDNFMIFVSYITYLFEGEVKYFFTPTPTPQLRSSTFSLIYFHFLQKCCCKGMKCPPMVYVFERC